MTVNFISAKCPECGSKLELPDTLEKAHCMYCGANIIIDHSNRSVNQINNLVSLIELELERGNWSKAIEYCNQALKINAKHSKVLQVLGVAYIIKGRNFLNEAIRMGHQYPEISSFKRAISKPSPESDKLINAYLKKAIDSYNKSLFYDRNDPQAYIRIAEAQLLMRGNKKIKEENRKTAWQNVKKAEQINPNYFEIKHFLQKNFSQK